MNISITKIILTSGFAMFSMFFGSGNLVFPIKIGITAQDSFIYAILGFVLTGVCLPFLGLMGIMQFKGDRKVYFSRLTPIPAFLLTFIMLGLMGPFGIVPRCSLLSYGSVEMILPFIPMWAFNAFFCSVIGLLIWQRNRIVEIIGVYMTPIKLGGFILLIIISLILAKTTLAGGPSGIDCLTNGLKQGYQTLDLVASFFFGSTIYEYIKFKTSANGDNGKSAHEKQIFKLGIRASLFGGFLLALCYTGFVLVGAKYAYILQTAKTENYLILLAHETIGKAGVPFVAITLVVSCLATATITSSLFADFLFEDIFKKRISREISILITLGVAYALSLIGFDAICSFLGTILEWVYPFLMCYAFFQMGSYFFQKKKQLST